MKHLEVGVARNRYVNSERLRGTRIIVTGGSRGIGRAIAERLVTEGSTVMCLDRIDPVDGLSENLYFQKCDVTNPGQVQRAVDATIQQFGGLDCLVNNAGLLEQRKSLKDVTPEQLHQYFDVNAVGPMLMLQAAYDALVESSWRGRVINVASRTFFTGSSQQPAYVASKGALIGITRTMAHELGEHGVTANAVVPAQIPTPGTLEYTSDETFARTMHGQSIQEYVTPDDLAGTVAFLVSQDGAMMTGQTLICDGGGLMR